MNRPAGPRENAPAGTAAPRTPGMDIAAVRRRHLDSIMAFGPIATMLLGTLLLGSIEASSFRIAALILWAPTPIGIPVLLAQGMPGPLQQLSEGRIPTLAWAVAGCLGAAGYALA